MQVYTRPRKVWGFFPI